MDAMVLRAADSPSYPLSEEELRQHSRYGEFAKAFLTRRLLVARSAPAALLLGGSQRSPQLLATGRCSCLAREHGRISAADSHGILVKVYGMSRHVRGQQILYVIVELHC